MNSHHNPLPFLRLILSLLLALIIVSCNNRDEPEWKTLDCIQLETGLLNWDTDLVKSEVEKLGADLSPSPIEGDPMGHKENLDLIVERLTSQCDKIAVKVYCYACIKTNPPQSEIFLVLDSIGTEIHRVIDLSTPDDQVMTFLKVHK